MSETTINPNIEVTQGEPPTVDGPSVKPGYLTTEFWQTNLVHLFAAVSSLLVFLNVNIAHLTTIQGLIPMVAIGASLLAQTAYNNKRANVKMHQISKWGEVNVAKLAPLAPVVVNLAEAADPKIKGAVDAFNEGWAEFPSPEAVPAPEAPADATDVEVPADEPSEAVEQ